MCMYICICDQGKLLYSLHAVMSDLHESYHLHHHHQKNIISQINLKDCKMLLFIIKALLSYKQANQNK